MSLDENDLLGRGSRALSWLRRQAWAGATAVAAAFIVGYLGLASAFDWPPVGRGQTQAPAAISEPATEPDDAPVDTPTPSSGSATPVAEAGQSPEPVLSKPNCTTLPEGTGLGFMRFMYIAENPWKKTDFNTRCVPMIEFFSGGPGKDGIPAIDEPRFEPVSAADSWLHPDEPVLVFARGDAVRAYPLQILLYHEIVNDAIGEFPFVVTYCPLCHTALVFDRTVDGQVYDFGTTGLLRGSDLVMYDRQTESWWQQFTGRALVGSMSGSVLTPIPAFHVTWDEFKREFPQGQVLSRDTGYDAPYGNTLYTYYDTESRPKPDFWSGDIDGRLPPMDRVATVSLGDSHVAFPFSVLAREPVVNYELGEQRIVVIYNPATLSVLGKKVIASAEAVGSTNVFLATVQGEDLVFQSRDGVITDENTGSQWNLLGEAVSGPLKGTRLTPVVSTDGFWFAWAAFKPDTAVYSGR